MSSTCQRTGARILQFCEIRIIMSPLEFSPIRDDTASKLSPGLFFHRGSIVDSSVSLFDGPLYVTVVLLFAMNL
jgi:hypothetical protein